MFNKLDAFLLQIIAILMICLSFHSCLNITEMNVRPIVVAPAETVLTCVKGAESENDTFEYLRWYKLIGDKWQIVKTTEPKVPETPNSTVNANTSHKLEGLVETEDTNIKLSPTFSSNAGLYKCEISSKSGKTEMIKEMRMVYKPLDNCTSLISLVGIEGNLITVKCIAPASNPATAINFFINYELAANEEVIRLPSIRIRSTSYGEAVELIQTVQELKIRATKDNLINNKLTVVCTAMFADVYSSSSFVEIPFLEQPLPDHKCLSAPIIILIVIIVLLLIVGIVAVVWVVMRKKKVNALNKVAELFNKPKTITVLVDNTNNTLSPNTNTNTTTPTNTNVTNNTKIE